MESTKQDKLEITYFTSIGAGCTLLRGGYYKIGKLVHVNLTFRCGSTAVNADTSLVVVPKEYQGNAPLSLFCPDQSPIQMSGTCRVANSNIRAGATLTTGKEYCIQGTYFEQ